MAFKKFQVDQFSTIKIDVDKNVVKMKLFVNTVEERLLKVKYTGVKEDDDKADADIIQFLNKIAPNLEKRIHEWVGKQLK